MSFRQRESTTPADSVEPPSGRDTFVFSPFSLRTDDVEVPLAEGETTLGRSLECTVVVDGPLVSRRHVVLRVAGDRVSLRDAGSSNGVIVNGVRIQVETVLELFDTFAIGDNVFELIPRSGVARGRTSTEPPPRITRPGRQSAPPTQATVKASAFELLGVVADKALALDRHQEAVRLLGSHIQVIHRATVRGEPVEKDVAVAAVTYAFRIAAAARDGSWAERGLEILSRCGLVPAPETVDLLYPIATALQPCHPLLKQYAQAMAKQRDALAPTDRFALKRIEGLERLVALKAP